MIALLYHHIIITFFACKYNFLFTFPGNFYIIDTVLNDAVQNFVQNCQFILIGVWLSLVRAHGWGP